MRMPQIPCAILAAAVVVVLPACTQDLPSGPSASILAITPVNVLPMDTDRVLPNHTVIVEDQKIAYVGPSDEATIPEGASIVDGTGKYLLPGLADIHTHPSYETDLWALVLYGVTFIRNLSTDLERHLAWREAAKRDDVLYPSMIVSSRMIAAEPPPFPIEVVGGRTVATPEQARALVQQQAAAGVDLVKVFPRHSATVWQALIDEADAQGLWVAGHARIGVALGSVLQSGIRTLEHMSGYAYALQSEPWTAETEWPERAWSLGTEQGYWVTADESRFAPLAREIAESGVWTVPTLTVHHNSYDMTDPEVQAFLRDPRAGLMHPEDLARSLSNTATEEFAAEADRAFENKIRMVTALHAAGANLLAGTDASNPFIVHGISLHDELVHFVAAGMTPYEAIRTATVEPARMLGQEDLFGRVAEGLRADLLLVDEDPLEDIANLQRISGVVLRGRWLSEERLARLRHEILDAHERAKAAMEAETE